MNEPMTALEVLTRLEDFFKRMTPEIQKLHESLQKEFLEPLLEEINHGLY